MLDEAGDRQERVEERTPIALVGEDTDSKRCCKHWFIVMGFEGDVGRHLPEVTRGGLLRIAGPRGPPTLKADRCDDLGSAAQEWQPWAGEDRKIYIVEPSCRRHECHNPIL